MADRRAIPSRHRNFLGLLTARLHISLVSPDRNPYISLIEERSNFVKSQIFLLRLLFVSIAAASLATSIANAQDTHLYWGDTHLHTSYSTDAYSLGNFNADPDTAYRFAKGMPVLHPSLRTRVRIARPLDFLVVSDHAEMLGLQAELMKGNPLMISTSWGKSLRAALEINPGAMRTIKPEERQQLRLSNAKRSMRRRGLVSPCGCSAAFPSVRTTQGQRT